MQSYTARELLGMTFEEAACLPKRHIIVFEDGISLETTTKKSHYTRVIWEMIHAYPKIKICSHHHVQGCPIIKSGDRSVDTNKLDNAIMDSIYADILVEHNLFYPSQKAPLWEIESIVKNLLYNIFSKRSMRHISAIDILDILEIVDHPEIKYAFDHLDPTHEAIAAYYELIQRVIKTDPTLRNNNLVMAVNAGAVNMNQFLQCVGCRGFVTEVDGEILAHPVMTNYTYGIHTLYDYLAESLSAPKSLYLSEAPLQDAEFFARRLQLLTMPVEGIDWKDCGTTNYNNWYVCPPKYAENGVQVYPGDLAFMVGKYYLDEDKDELVEITGKEKHLYGKVIKYRCGLLCESSDKTKICWRCFGAMSQNVGGHQNLGHLCSATITQQTSQSVLSNKHVEASSVVANVILSESARKYFITNKKANGYRIAKPALKHNMRVVVSRDQAPGLIDILSATSDEDLMPTRISNIDYIEVAYRNTDRANSPEVVVPIETQHTGRNAVLSVDYLKYLKTHGWDTDQNGNYVFGFEEWDIEKDFLIVPDREYSYSNHSHEVAKAIEANMESLTNRHQPGSPAKTLQEVFEIVNNKLNVNIAAIEVIIYAMMIPHPDSCDLARGAKNAVLGVANTLIRHRSGGGSYGFQNISETMTNPRQFFKLDRPDHPLDICIDPAGVMKNKARRKRASQDATLWN